jgi:hypothetical protein
MGHLDGTFFDAYDFVSEWYLSQDTILFFFLFIEMPR